MYKKSIDETQLFNGFFNARVFLVNIHLVYLNKKKRGIPMQQLINDILYDMSEVLSAKKLYALQIVLQRN